jgi:uncharacterized protein (DUF4415 family)
VSKPPIRRPPTDAHAIAEATFRKSAPKPAEPLPAAKKASLPGAKELVSLRIDQDVLEHFQDEGAGWQDRINAALRKAAGLDREAGTE